MKRLLLLACLLLAASLTGAQAPIGGVGGVGLTGRAGAQALASPYILCKSAVAVVTPADTTEDTLYTCPVPANAMGANGALRISAVVTVNNNANAKTFRVHFSGGAGTQYQAINLAGALSYSFLTWITNRGVTNSQIGMATGTGFSVTPNPVATSAVDTTASTTIVITGQKAVSTDTLTLESVLVELLSDGT